MTKLEDTSLAVVLMEMCVSGMDLTTPMPCLTRLVTKFLLWYTRKRSFTQLLMLTAFRNTLFQRVHHGMITRFTAPPTHMCFNQSGTTLVAGASDFLIKIVDVSSGSQKTLSGHEAPVLSVALHPKELYVASSSCDGSFKVWSVSNQTCLKTWNGLTRCSDISLVKSFCRLCWDPRGDNLLVPVDKEIIVYGTKDWNKAATLTDPKIKEAVSILSFSPCGRYLAASCYDGLLLIFDWNKKTCIESYKHDKTMTAVSWNPKNNNEIVFCDNQGQIGLFENVISSENKSAKVDSSASAAVDNVNDAASDLFDDMDDDMLAGAIGPDIPEVDMGETSENEFSAKHENIFNDEESKDGNANLSDVDNSSVAAESLLKTASAGSYSEPAKTTPLQRAFQPSSTPEHLTHRFMKWNMVGIIKQYNSEGENSIDIEFHDTAVHHSMHLNNNVGYTMADMSNEAVVLACGTDEESGQSKLTCLHFGSWDNSKEWSMSLPEGEEILAVAATDNWVAAATSSRLIRLFTVTGIQKEILSIPGPIVCLTGYKDQLMVVYHHGVGVPGDQCLGTNLYHVGYKKKCVLKGDLLPLSPKSFLYWAGFSNEGTPFYMDSDGIVNMLNRNFGNTWMQACNTKSFAKGKSDHYWIISILESQQQIRCVPCKGSRFPPTLPRPTLSVLPLQIPLCELSTEKSQYEEKMWRMQLLKNSIEHCVSHGDEVDLNIREEALRGTKEELMKLFALSVRSDRECRAIDICEMMPDQHTLQLAIKYASRLTRMQLAQRISELARNRQAEEIERLNRGSRKYQDDSEEEEEEEEEEEAVVAVKEVRPKQRPAPSESKTHSRPAARRKQADAAAEEEEDDETENVEEEMDEEDEKENSLENEKEEDEKLKPTPRHLKESQSQRGFPSSGNVTNPFKVGTPQKLLPATKGTQVFDSMTRNKPTKLSSLQDYESKPEPRKSVPAQMKLFSSTKLTSKDNKSSTKSTKSNKTAVKDSLLKSGFPAWFKENREDLEEENPDMSPEDLKQLATDRYKDLTTEEKEVWLKKSQSEADEGKPLKKRKRSEQEESQNGTAESDSKKTIKKKKSLSGTTNSKLANFMFKRE